MRKNSMMRNSFAVYAALMAVILLAVSGCTNPFDMGNISNPSENEGLFTLNIEGIGRTILPVDYDMKDFVYTLTFHSASSSTLPPIKHERDLTDIGDPIPLPVGLYNLSVTAYADADRTLETATGYVSNINIVFGQSVTRVINMIPIIERGSEGTFAWNIRYPADVTLAYVSISPFNGSIGGFYPGESGSEIIPFDYKKIENDKIAESGSIVLNTGYYRVLFVMEIQDDDTENDVLSVVREEFLHVYKNLTSLFEFEFNTNHFVVKKEIYTLTLSGQLHTEEWPTKEDESVIYIPYSPNTDAGNIVFSNTGAEGTIDANGAFTITVGVPAVLHPIKDSVLYWFLESCYNHIEFSTTDANSMLLELHNGRNALYRQLLSTTKTGHTYETVYYVYLDRDLVVTAPELSQTIKSSDGSYSSTKSSPALNLGLTRGWNVVYIKEDKTSTSVSDNLTIQISIGNPGHLKWVIREDPEMHKFDPPKNISAVISTEYDNVNIRYIINVEWEYTGAPRYFVYRSDSLSGTFKKVGETGHWDNYHDYDVEIGKTYFYKVSSVNGRGEESDLSEAVASPPGITFQPMTANTYVSGVIEGYDNSVWYSFTATPGRTYFVWMDEANNCYTRIFSSSGQLYFDGYLLHYGYQFVSDSDLVYIQVSSHYYWSSYNMVYNDIGTQPPAPPQISIANFDPWNISIYWNQHNSSGTQFIVYRSTSESGPYIEVQTTYSNNYTDMNVTYGTTYYYRVEARNQYSETAMSNTVTATAGAIATPLTMNTWSDMRQIDASPDASNNQHWYALSVIPGIQYYLHEEDDKPSTYWKVWTVIYDHSNYGSGYHVYYSGDTFPYSFTPMADVIFIRISPSEVRYNDTIANYRIMVEPTGNSDFVAVTDIIFWGEHIDHVMMTVGNPLSITATVVPSNATKKTIVWNIIDDSIIKLTTISDSTIMLDPIAPGIAMILAVIPDGAGEGKAYTKEFNVSVIPSASADIQFIVTFDLNGGTGVAPVPLIVNEGVSVTFASNDTFSSDSYVFAGWNTLADGSGDTYPAGSSYIPTSDIILYAKWETP